MAAALAVQTQALTKTFSSQAMLRDPLIVADVVFTVQFVAIALRGGALSFVAGLR